MVIINCIILKQMILIITMLRFSYLGINGMKKFCLLAIREHRLVIIFTRNNVCHLMEWEDGLD